MKTVRCVRFLTKSVPRNAVVVVVDEDKHDLFTRFMRIKNSMKERLTMFDSCSVGSVIFEEGKNNKGQQMIVSLNIHRISVRKKGTLILNLWQLLNQFGCSMRGQDTTDRCLQTLNRDADSIPPRMKYASC